MMTTLKRIFALAMLLMVSFGALYAAPSEEEHASTEHHEEESGIDFLGKIADHDYFEIVGYKIYLPKIMLVEGEWFFFANSHAAVESGLFVEEGHAIHPADPNKHISIDFSITSHLVYFWIAVILTLIIFIRMASKYKGGVGRTTEPKGVGQNMFEVFFIFIRDDIAKDNIGEDKYRKFLPYLCAVFFSIMFMNLFGLLPWGATATADLTVTATLAFITFLVVQVTGSKDHWRHVFAFPGVHPLMWIILTPIEIIGLFTKPFALAVRLFANMLSGKLMVMAILGLAFILGGLFGSAAGYGSSVFVLILTSVLYVLKAFVGLLQAYIFTLLSAVFIGMSNEEHDHEHGVEHAH